MKRQKVEPPTVLPHLESTDQTAKILNDRTGAVKTILRSTSERTATVAATKVKFAARQKKRKDSGRVKR